ncbi:putative porin [Aestuariibaculum sp. TT11]|uniref:Putative porin n=2 Tax=Aestuariibaculum sediminum TaxID=2770637 RepID=A0A8J6Q3G4_9FLAO|nr:putative porin [Aestuariibaculum sediminum]
MVVNKQDNSNHIYLFKVAAVCLLFFLDLAVFAQERPSRISRELGFADEPDSTKLSPKDLAKITDYLIISHDNDTTYVDTSLTIKKEYKFNYLRKDNFGLMPFSNLGQTYNSLTYNFQNSKLMPDFGALGKHFNYMEVEDIYYYRVPTPLTELFFKTAFEQGQLADSFFSINTSPQLNFSLAYKGLRSLGKYQHILASTGNFRFTTNYQTKNARYVAKAHIVSQDIYNQENGGIRDDNIEFFETGEEDHLDRSIFEVNFEDAGSKLVGKRFYLNHAYNLVQKNDSLARNHLSIGHILSFEDKYNEYTQSTSNNYFGDAFRSRDLRDRNTLERFYNQVHVNYSNNIIGDVQFNINNTNFNYGYDKVVVLNGQTITNRFKGDVFAAGGKYHKQYKGFDLSGELGLNISGDFDGNYIKGTASFKLKEDVFASASINHSSKAPNFNTLLYQSDYINYNWQNNFSNIETQQLQFKINYKELANITVDYSTITDYVYFKEDETTFQVRPEQFGGTINYLRVKFENEFVLGKFALNNTVLYQNENTEGVLNVPQLTTRNTFYFSSHMFDKALFLQTGVTMKYFTKYYMNAYNPLIAEFYVQNQKEYGDFPLLDFFINLRIRQTRIFAKAEHFNSAFTGYNFYSAPNNPYRDFTVRFGVVWNFFL